MCNMLGASWYATYTHVQWLLLQHKEATPLLQISCKRQTESGSYLVLGACYTHVQQYQSRAHKSHRPGVPTSGEGIMLNHHNG